MSAGGTGQATGQGGDRPARDPAGTAALERRYRRLLRCYPPAHRAFHREEMLGVLLATARPGQRTPGLGQTVNLAACGLVIRVRRIPGWLAADAGQDALAVVSLIAPAVVFILLVLQAVVFILLVPQQAAMNAAASAGSVVPGLLLGPPSFGKSVVVMIAWLAVVVLGLTGRRRTAAKIAFISLTLALLALLLGLVVLIQQVHSFYFNTFPGELFPFLPFGDVPVVLASLAACSLALSPGPRRGLAIVGWRRACLMIAGLSAGFGFPFIVPLVNPAAPIWDLAFRLLDVLAIAVAVAVTCVRGPVGRRVAGLVATGLLPTLAVAIPLREVPAVRTAAASSSVWVRSSTIARRRRSFPRALRTTRSVSLALLAEYLCGAESRNNIAKAEQSGWAASLRQVRNTCRKAGREADERSMSTLR